MVNDVDVAPGTTLCTGLDALATKTRETRNRSEKYFPCLHAKCFLLLVVVGDRALIVRSWFFSREVFLCFLFFKRADCFECCYEIKNWRTRNLHGRVQFRVVLEVSRGLKYSGERRPAFLSFFFTELRGKQFFLFIFIFQRSASKPGRSSGSVPNIFSWKNFWRTALYERSLCLRFFFFLFVNENKNFLARYSRVKFRSSQVLYCYRYFYIAKNGIRSYRLWIVKVIFALASIILSSVFIYRTVCNYTLLFRS